MLKYMWGKIVMTVVVIGVVLSFFAIIELIRAYQVLRDLHPSLGYLYALVLFGLVVLGVAYYIISVRLRPPVLMPPKVGDLSTAGRHDLIIYGKYLIRRMRALSGNVNITEQSRRSMSEKVVVLAQAVKGAGDDESLRAVVLGMLENEVRPALAQLGVDAEREVQRCVRDVMIGVAVSPWRAVDLLVVIYRNVKMVNGIMTIYESRPSLKGQTGILWDIVKIVATVNILNYGSKLAQNLFSSVPFAGRFIEDIAQGAGAGLLTSMAGHAAIERCGACSAWNDSEARHRIAGQVGVFAADLKGIVVHDVIPLLSGRITRPGAAGIQDGDDVRQGVERAMDATSSVMGEFVNTPPLGQEKTAGSVILEKTAVASRVTWGLLSRAGVFAGIGLKRGGKFMLGAASKTKTVLGSGIRKIRRRHGGGDTGKG